MTLSEQDKALALDFVEHYLNFKNDTSESGDDEQKTVLKLECASSCGAVIEELVACIDRFGLSPEDVIGVLEILKIMYAETHLKSIHFRSFVEVEK